MLNLKPVTRYSFMGIVKLCTSRTYILEYFAKTMSILSKNIVWTLKTGTQIVCDSFVPKSYRDIAPLCMLIFRHNSWNKVSIFLYLGKCWNINVLSLYRLIKVLRSLQWIQLKFQLQLGCISDARISKCMESPQYFIHRTWRLWACSLPSSEVSLRALLSKAASLVPFTLGNSWFISSNVSNKPEDKLRSG